MKLPEFAIELLQGKNFATIATLMPDGSPQASVIWVDTDGEHIIFNTEDARIKPRNMRRDPRVAIAVHSAEDPYKQAMIRGRVVEITQKDAEAHVDRMAKKYLGVDKYPGPPGETRLIVKILPERVGLMGDD